jgi:AraC-like DNA-binding protein
VLKRNNRLPCFDVEPAEPASGVLVVRASGAGAALAALNGSVPKADDVQLVMRAPVPRRLPQQARTLAVPGCTVELRPAGEPEQRSGVVVLTVATHRLSIDFAELQPLMFQQIPVDRPLAALFASAVGQLLGAASQPDTLDQHGAGHYLVGLVELVLRSALRSQLHRSDTAAARYRDAVDYVNRHLTDPDLSAERIADALFISRRRLYQLFDDGDGISGRIRRMRVARAKELLADPTRGRHGIGELARQCGFVNSAHFSRTFRKLTGTTPREFRDGVRSAEVDGRDQPAEDA